MISAVIVASSRTTSQENTNLYLHHMQMYLDGLCELFPQYRFLPNQHMALLAEYLQFYSPVHSWWTFPFERLIGMLQHILNNFQYGEFHLHISFRFLDFFFRATGRNPFYHLHKVCQPSHAWHLNGMALNLLLLYLYLGYSSFSYLSKSMLTASAGMLSFSSIACRINISLFLLYFSFIIMKHSQIPNILKYQLMSY